MTTETIIIITLVAFGLLALVLRLISKDDIYDTEEEAEYWKERHRKANNKNG